MKLRKIVSPLILIFSLAGCATQVTPEMRAQAEKRKGETIAVSTSLEASDNFSKSCGWAKPNETVGCSQGILSQKLAKKAKDYCVFYRMGKIRFDGTSGALYNRATFAAVDVTCLGDR